MGSGVKGQWIGTLVQRQVPGPSFSIHGRRLSDAIAADPVTGLGCDDEPLRVPANADLGPQQMDFRRGLCSVRPVATEART